jgi:hypothetical protein
LIATITEGGRVTQVGEGQDAAKTASAMTAFGAPTVGEVLADRYQLEEHINDDSVGRQVWRGVDVILRRPVAVVLRYPGGDSAMEMLQAAVTASRVVHPNLVGVYDAIDEGERAYVVREWVAGAALREIVTSSGPLDAERATTVAHAVSAAVAAVHATGMVHGNVHPGTVLVDHDGRVVLADARGDGTATAEADARAVGGVLYYALTGHWPQTEAGRTALPDAVRDSTGMIASPRQNRAGVPDYLDELTMDLLDERITPPSAEVLAAELGRLDSAGDEQFFYDSGPLRFTDEDRPEPHRRSGRKIALVSAGLALIALVGLVIGIPLVNGGGSNTASGTTPAGVSTPTATGGGGTNTGGGTPQTIELTNKQVRLIDPKGDRTDARNIARAVDGNENSAWETTQYNGNFVPDPGGYRQGIGILLNLGQPTQVSNVEVDFSAVGVSATLYGGDSDPGANLAADTSACPGTSAKPCPQDSADATILKTYQAIGDPIDKHTGTRMVFPGADANKKYQYLVVWITSMPKADNGQYQIGIQEITVRGSGS